MTLRLILALVALTATPALAAGISVDMPNLTFPEPAPTISTMDCPPTVATCDARS